MLPMQGGELGGRQSAATAVRPDLVVVLPPGSDGSSGLRQCLEPMFVQAFVPELAGEALESPETWRKQAVVSVSKPARLPVSPDHSRICDSLARSNASSSVVLTKSRKPSLSSSTWRLAGIQTAIAQTLADAGMKERRISGVIAPSVNKGESVDTCTPAAPTGVIWDAAQGTPRTLSPYVRYHTD